MQKETVTMEQFLTEFQLVLNLLLIPFHPKHAVIAYKGGDEEKDFLHHKVEWKGHILDLKALYCPKFDHVPGFVL